MGGARQRPDHRRDTAVRRRPQPVGKRLAAQAKKLLPERAVAAVGEATHRSEVVYRLKVRAAGRRCDVFLVSYPKVGRTWLRVLLGKAFMEHYGLRRRDLMPATAGRVVVPGMPRILSTHDDATVDKPAGAVFADKSPYRHHRVLLMVRDPRDVIVSQYFQRTRRKENAYTGSLADFIREPRGSIATMIAFYNAWADQRCVPAGFHLLRYEDLRRNTAEALRGALDFVGAGAVSVEIVHEAIEFASFERMRAREAEGEARHKALRPWDPHDSDSFKARRGVVGGYVDYFSDEQVAQLNARVADLDPLYGY